MDNSEVYAYKVLKDAILSKLRELLLRKQIDEKFICTSNAVAQIVLDEWIKKGQLTSGKVAIIGSVAKRLKFEVRQDPLRIFVIVAGNEYAKSLEERCAQLIADSSFSS